MLPLPVLTAMFVAVASAQEPATSAVRPEYGGQQKFRSGTSLVALNVTVTQGRKFVTGLGAEDFELYEDGVPQELRFFETTDVPLDLILLLDTSSSMRDKMPAVHDAARAFMRILRPQDRGAVVAFNDRVSIAQELTGDPAAIERAINSTTARGSTALHNALYIALKQFGRKALSAGEVRRQVIAVLSDGDDTSSLLSFEDVLALAQTTGVTIYTIGLQSQYSSAAMPRDELDSSRAQYTLKRLARETGAASFFPSGVHQLRVVYGQIADELDAQYALAYTPTNPDHDGRFRRILVRVTADPSYRPRTRTGYIAEGTGIADHDGSIREH